MVGIVIVSHSRPLAQAVIDLVRQMAPADVPHTTGNGLADVTPASRRNRAMVSSTPAW